MWEKTLELKQSEFNFLLESKDQEIKFLQEEILKLNESVEIVKRDRIRDQKIINDYDGEIKYLNSRLQDMNGKQEENLSNINRESTYNIKLEVILIFKYSLEKNSSSKKNS